MSEHLVMKVTAIQHDSIVRLPDGRVGRLVKDHKTPMVILGQGKLGVSVRKDASLECILSTAQMAGYYLEHEVCAECFGAGRIPNPSGTGDDAGGWADHCPECGGDGKPKKS